MSHRNVKGVCCMSCPNQNTRVFSCVAFISTKSKISIVRAKLKVSFPYVACMMCRLAKSFEKELLSFCVWKLSKFIKHRPEGLLPIFSKRKQSKFQAKFVKWVYQIKIGGELLRHNWKVFLGIWHHHKATASIFEPESRFRSNEENNPFGVKIWATAECWLK